MRTTNPLPAQVAAMDKDTVLGLLKLMSSGNLLKRGMEVNLAVSRWTWSLLAKLPDRGALNSEEIGIVRELGKKAVLIGVGLREDKDWEEGMQEVEANYEEGDETLLDVDDIGEATTEPVEEDDTDILNEEEILDEEPDIDDLPNPLLDLDGSSSTTKAHDELVAAKARMLSLLVPSTPAAEGASEVAAEVHVEFVEETSSPKAEVLVDQSAMRQWNSSATVDMILTIAGEIYGQRDLLEFRGAWGNSV